MKYQSPIFSVILPTYNRKHSLRIAIQSVVDQNVTNWELLVIDDGSTDQTLETVKKFHDHRIKYCRQEHNERSLARNLGILRSTGKYVCFLDDDDYYKSDYLQVFLNYLSSNDYPAEILRTGFLIKKNANLSPSSLYSEIEKKHPVLYFSATMCGIWSLCIPKEFLSEHTFPPDFPHWQDTHLALRLFALYPLKQLNAWTYVYCHHQDMGSIALFKGPNIETRVGLQVDAINDLFDHYHELIGPYLREKDRRRLIAEKMYRGARILKADGKHKAAWSMLLKAPLSPSLLPSVLRFVLPFSK